MTFALEQKLTAVNDQSRVDAFDAMMQEWCDLACAQNVPKPDPFAGMKFSLDMEDRILTCTFEGKAAKLSLASVDPYLFLALTVGEIIDSAKAFLLKQVDELRAA